MGGGLSIRNDSKIDLLVTLKQVGPLHWKEVKAGEVARITSGRVWFSVVANVYNGQEPTNWDVAAPFVLGVVGAGLAVVTMGGNDTGQIDVVRFSVRVRPCNDVYVWCVYVFTDGAGQPFSIFFQRRT